MITPLPPYPAYKPSSVDWLGDVPAHWEVRRLRNLAEMRVSNVDKHVKDGELPVRLCNYVDVYKIDSITESIGFMRATATAAEIERFRLEAGDVLITKDSETWNDIGVPALVQGTADDLVCGYHLALLRPLKSWLNGPYLFRVLQSPTIAYQFHVSANGVTRYGLTHEAIKSVLIPLPPLPEQRAIANYLDHADRRIQRYIHAKQKRITLLHEARQAIIHRAVIRGLDPDVPLKPSGVDWLGDVPAHWEIRRAKYLYREVNERSSTGAEELMSVSHKTGVTPRKKNVTMFRAETNVGYKLCRSGDIVINTMWAYMAALGVARQVGLVSPSYNVYRPIDCQKLNQDYMDSLLRTETYRIEYLIRSLASLSLAFGCILNPSWISRCCTPLPEQTAIAAYLDQATAAIDAAIDSARRQTELMRAYRASLIAHVVTGKLDVRAAAAQLPPESAEQEPVGR